jgi:hypothetical protein
LNNGFAPLGHVAVRERAIAIARRQGIAAVAFVNSFHFSALWAELEPIAEQGIGGFAFRAGVSRVAPEGGVLPVFGTNPIGFAWPRHGRPPLVIDLATSAIARGVIGASLLGLVGAGAGIASAKNHREITIGVRFRDGRSFVGTTNSAVVKRLQAFMFVYKPDGDQTLANEPKASKENLTLKIVVLVAAFVLTMTALVLWVM